MASVSPRRPTDHYYGRGQAAELRRAVHQLLLEHKAAGELPTSNRFLFYELRQRGGPLYGHSSRGQGRSQDQNLSDASTFLRHQGLAPWSWIVDETRSLAAYKYAETVADYLVDSVAEARIDCWNGEPPPLIICESRTFGGVLDRTLAPEYLCPVTATNGQVGGFLRTNVVPLLAGNERRVLYVGDRDLAGADIEGNTRDVLVREAGEREWTRVALTAEQVAERDLPTVEKIDRRFRPRCTRRSRSRRSGRASSLGSSAARSTRCSPSRSSAFKYAKTGSARRPGRACSATRSTRG
jgi:hypothetical protein